MSTEPKPATGEWTLQSISETLINGGYQGLLDAHNDALAAERAKIEVLTSERAAAVVSLQQQLAAERKKVQTLTDALARYYPPHE